MNHSKRIEFDKSKLISLKAELLRKQDEVSKAKLEPRNQIHNFVPSSKFCEKEDEDDVPTKTSLSNEPEDNEILKRSREKLEKKALLYEHLSQHGVKSEKEEHFLVDFDRKNPDYNSNNEKTDIRVEISDDDDIVTKNDDSDDEWVDYTDCLGRTRRCHKSDVEHIKKVDDSLRKSLKPSLDNDEQMKWIKEGSSSINDDPPDPYKEMLYKQWDEKERELLTKDTVYYEDIRFNEARTHGVSYYALSGDDKVRARQQEELKKLHEQTEKAQTAAADLRARRDEAMQQRVRAARARQRARAGLPPEEEPEEKSSVTSMLFDFVEEQKKVYNEKARIEREAKELEAQKEREKIVREWDVGKEGVEGHRVLTQEEWVHKKRKERPDEFAPPQISSYNVRNKEDSRTFDKKGFYAESLTWDDVRPSKQATPKEKGESGKSLYFTTKKKKEEIKNKYYDPSVNTGETFVPSPIREDRDEEVVVTEKIDERGAGVEIEPPPTYEYYGPVNKKRRDENKVDVREAFEKGMERLEKRAVEKAKKRNAVTIDDV